MGCSAVKAIAEARGTAGSVWLRRARWPAEVGLAARIRATAWVGHTAAFPAWIATYANHQVAAGVYAEQYFGAFARPAGVFQNHTLAILHGRPGAAAKFSVKQRDPYAISRFAG